MREVRPGRLSKQALIPIESLAFPGDSELFLMELK